MHFRPWAPRSRRRPMSRSPPRLICPRASQDRCSGWRSRACRNLCSWRPRRHWRALYPWRRARRRPRGRRSGHRPAGCALFPARACWRPAYKARCGADERCSASRRLPEVVADYKERLPCGKVTVAMRFLSLQSHVAYGYVGNRAATFPLQRLGHEVWAVNTVEFSNHTGYGAWRGRSAPADQVAEIVQGVEALGVLSGCDALLTGYVGDAALADVVLDTARKVRAANPKAIWCCDPVLGDTDTGIYVKPGIDAFFRDRAIPAADIVTPNHFELEHLTGRKIATMAEALAAARGLLPGPKSKGPRLVLITSLRRADAA